MDAFYWTSYAHQQSACEEIPENGVWSVVAGGEIQKDSHFLLFAARIYLCRDPRVAAGYEGRVELEAEIQGTADQEPRDNFAGKEAEDEKIAAEIW